MSHNASAEQLGRQLGKWSCVAVGLPTWILVNGTWAALSGIVNKAPESFAISAYLILCLSTGNLCPLLLNAYVLRGIQARALAGIVVALELLGLAAGVAMAVSWPYTVSIGSQETSLALLLCFLAVGAASSAGNVAKYMLMANLSGGHTSHLSTGMALGSMIAGLLGIARGFTESQGFSVTAYLLVLCVSFVPSAAVALSLWRALPQDAAREHERSLLRGGEPLSDCKCPEALEGAAEGPPAEEAGAGAGLCCFNGRDLAYLGARSPARSFLLTQAAMAGLGYGLVPALLSTVCAKFASPYTVLLLATGISAVIDPIGRHLTASRSLKTRRDVFAAAGVLAALAALMLVLGCLPSNELYRAGVGGILPATLYIMFIPLFGFLNTSMFLICKREASSSPAHAGSRLLVESDLVRLCGIMTQTGAMLGSVVSFAFIYLFL